MLSACGSSSVGAGELVGAGLPGATSIPLPAQPHHLPQGRLEAFFGPAKVVSSTMGKRKEPEPKGKGAKGGAGGAKKGKLGAMGKKK